MITKDGKEGVVSVIQFPIGQDPHAVSMAIASLLSEGWKFEGLTVTHISLKRIWEYTFEGNQAKGKS